MNEASSSFSSFIQQFCNVFCLLRDHPRLSCFLLLLFTPPFFPLVSFFTPLLFSTALCVFALISLIPYVSATDAEVERQSKIGTGVEILEGSNRLVQKGKQMESVGGFNKEDISWFEWLNGMNEVGRTWMEKRLREEGSLLSQPANRDTVLALIEGSFAELASGKEVQSDANSRDIGREGAVAMNVRVTDGRKIKEIEEDPAVVVCGASLGECSRTFNLDGEKELIAPQKSNMGDEKTSQKGEDQNAEHAINGLVSRRDADIVSGDGIDIVSIDLPPTNMPNVSEELQSTTIVATDQVPISTGISDGWKESPKENASGARACIQASDDGPKFDEELVAKDEALVRQELQVLEQEMEEASAKLDELLVFKKLTSRRKSTPAALATSKKSFL